MKLNENYNSWHIDQEELDNKDILEYPWYNTVYENLPDLNGLNILEIGCGRGKFLSLISKKYKSAILLGLDFSESAITIANQKRANTNLKFIVSDAQNINLPSNNFDLIISCETLEHIPEPQKMAKEIFRLLKPNGKFILTTENYFNGMYLAWLQTWLTKKPFNSGSGVQPLENFFTFWKVNSILSQSGLIVKKTLSNHYQWLLLPGIDPRRLRTDKFNFSLLNKIFKPFGRHYTFIGHKELK